MEEIYCESQLIALIIRNSYSTEGIEFYTSGESSQQLGYMNRPNGFKIQPHRHLFNRRTVTMTQETLFVRAGKIRVDFYSDNQQYLKSAVLITGDVILLAGGGHGFEMLERSEIIEVKQGPYDADKDKIRFDKFPGPYII